MKKLFLLLMAAVLMTACEGPMGPMGPEGEPGGLFTKVEYFTVKPKDWVFMGPTDNPNEVYYRCLVVPKFYNEVSWEDFQYIYDNGTFHAFLFHSYNMKDETQTVLPYVLNWSDNNNRLCVETVYFDYSLSYVAFYVSYSGGNVNSSPEEDMHFRIVANW